MSAGWAARGAAARAGIFAAWAALVVALYAAGWGARFHPIRHVLPPLLVAAGIALAAWALGSGLSRLLRLEDAAPSTAPGLPSAPLRIALGLAALSWCWTALGAAGLLARSVAWGLLAAGVAAGAVLLRRHLARPGVHAAGRWPGVLSSAGGLPAALLVLALAVALPMALAPPASTDELTYHLTIPKWFIAAGRIFVVPRFAHAAFPFQVEMLYTWALLLGQPVAAKLLHLLMGLLAAACVAAGAGARPGGGPIAAAILLTTPAFLIVSSWAWVDAATTLYVVLGCLVLLRLRRTLASGDAVAAGLLWGMALGTKYTAFLYLAVALPACLLPGRAERVSRRLAGVAGAVIAIALVAASPWLARNAVSFGNPVHPFGAGAWGPEIEGHHELMTTVRGPRDTARDRLEGLVRYTLWDDRTDGTIGFLFLLAAPVLAFVPLSPSARRLHVAGVVAVAILSAGFAGSVRYQLPGLALLAAAAGEWLAAWWAAGRLRRAAAAALLALAGLSNLWIAAWHDRELFDPLRVALGYEKQGAYLERMEPAHAILQRLNRDPDPAVKVLALSFDRLFWLDRPVVAAGPLDVSVARDWCVEAGTPEAFLERLAAEGITHVLVDRRAFERDVLRGPGRGAWGEPALRTLGGALERCRRVASTPGVDLLEVPRAAPGGS